MREFSKPPLSISYILSIWFLIPSVALHLCFWYRIIIIIFTLFYVDFQ